MLARSRVDYSHDDEKQQLVNEPVKKKKVVRKKKVVKKKKKAQSFRKMMSVVLIIMAGIGVMMYLVGSSKITKLNTEVSNLEVYKSDLEKTKTDLSADLEGIKSSSRISEDAMYKLGMTYPQEGQIVYLSVADEVTDFTEGAELSGLSKLISIISGLF